MANRASLDQRPDAKLAMLGGSQGATVGTVDTRMVGGNMISTTYSYTNNVFAPPSGSGSLGGGATEPQEDPSAQLPDVRPSLWHSIEVLAIVYRLLRPFGVHSQASKTEPDSSLSPLEKDSGVSPSMNTPGEVYIRKMLHAGKGLPCWKPEPHEPLNHGEGVIPGDVGIFSVEGGFRKVFNLWDDEILIQSSPAARSYHLRYEIPPKPKVYVKASELDEGKALVEGLWYNPIYESDNTTISRFEFHHMESHQQGAVLALTSPGKLEELDDSNGMDLREFISRYAGLLFKYANAIRSINEGEALYIITGCIKSGNWALAAFRHPVTHPHHIPSLVRLPSGIRGDGSQNTAYAWRSPGTFDSYVGKSKVDGAQDQTLFLQGYKLDFSQTFRSQAKLGSSSFAKGRGSDGGGSFNSEGPASGGGGHADSRPSGGSGRGAGAPSGWKGGATAGSTETSDKDAQITTFPDEFQQRFNHPCDILNRFLLEETGSSFALCHDDDWRRVLDLGPTPSSGEASQEKHLKWTISVNHAVASLAFSDRGQQGSALVSEEGHANSTAQSEAGSGCHNTTVNLVAAMHASPSNSRAGEDVPQDVAGYKSEGEGITAARTVPRRVAPAAEHVEQNPHVERAISSKIFSPSLKDLLSLAPNPALDTILTLLISTYSNIQKIGVYRKQCEDMFGRCCALLVKLREACEGSEGSKTLRLADELEPVLERINVTTRQWSEWGPLQSFLKQAELKDGLDRLQRQLDGAILNFGASTNLETMYRSEAIHHITREEFRASLQAILDDQRELKKLLAISSPQPVEEVMMHLQTELQDPNIPQEQHDSFQKGLWDLRSKTAKLPPLSDLTGQVELNDRHPKFTGTYNDVYKGTWLGREQVAVRLPRTLSDTAVVHEKFQQEMEIWRAFDHPNVLPLYGIVYIGKHLYSVAPWMTYGTAISFVEKYPQTNVLKLLSEVTEGLEYLHSKGIVHGDLRGVNVLISEDGVARLSDFGLSKFLENCNKGMTSAATINPRWQAPEIIREKPLSRESDIWSLAMTFLELLTRHQPYSNIIHDFDVGSEVKKYKIPQRPKDQATIDAGLNDGIWELLKRCWKKPDDRPTVEEVKDSLARIRREVAGGPSPPRGRMALLRSITGNRFRMNRPVSSRGSEGGPSTPAHPPGPFNRFQLHALGLGHLRGDPQPGGSSHATPSHSHISQSAWSGTSAESTYSHPSSRSYVSETESLASSSRPSRQGHDHALAMGIVQPSHLGRSSLLSQPHTYQSLQGLRLQDYPQSGNSSLPPPFYAGTSPPNSWSSHSPGSAYSPLSSYSPVQPNRRPSHVSETQMSPALSNFLSSPARPNHRPSCTSETQPVAGILNSRKSLNQSSSQDQDNILTMEHSSAPRVQLFHLEHDSSSYQPRIPPRAYTDSRTYHATAQSIMAADSVNQDPLVQEAISCKEAVVFVNENGAVIAGTLDGLIERLINNFNLQRDEEFREVILTACVDLIDTDHLFGMLMLRFNEAELDILRHPQDRMTVQHNVFKVLHYWLSSWKVPVNGQLLLQMGVFCKEAIQTKVSPTMVERAAGLLDLINERARQDSQPKPVLSPGRPVLQPNEITPQGLALALTLLEGDKYKAILPCDYLANQCRRSGFNGVDDAASTNNRIIEWIKQSLLHWDALQQRAGVVKFYLSTAQECRKLRNYHSLIAIAVALGSTSVMSLELTKRFLSKKQMAQYEELVQLTDPEDNHYRYRRALKEVIDPVYADFCIPWIAVHLKELQLVLRANKRAVMVENKPLINFQRYTLFMDKLKEVLAHSPPDLERFREQGQLAYLEDKLRSMRLGEQAEGEMEERRKSLRVDEVKLDKSKAMKLEMNVPKAARTDLIPKKDLE